MFLSHHRYYRYLPQKSIVLPDLDIMSHHTLIPHRYNIFHLLAPLNHLLLEQGYRLGKRYNHQQSHHSWKPSSRTFPYRYYIVDTDYTHRYILFDNPYRIYYISPPDNKHLRMLLSYPHPSTHNSLNHHKHDNCPDKQNLPFCVA